MIQHSEAVYFYRKMLFEVAQKLYPDLLVAMSIGAALHNTWNRQKTLEDTFEAQLVEKHGYNVGKAYNPQTFPESCTNLNILYHTNLTGAEGKK